ncbi:MAG: beta-lactamase family protein [Candidatus Saccharibacteria bacterium]|nr:beta-lactamase family protein [Rhodoferax sp.]
MSLLISVPPVLAHDLGTVLQSIQADAQAPLSSLSVLALRDGQVVYEGHFGHRRMSGFAPDVSTATNTNTLYRIASVSKLVTTIGAMRLVDAGRLDLDADISRYLGFQVRNPHFPDAPISSRMLLNHTSTLRDDAGYVFDLKTPLQDVLSPKGKIYGAGAMWAVPSAATKNAPGQYFQYVNLNFGVLATVMEAIAKERFDQYMQRAVLGPMDLKGGYLTEGLQQDDIKNIATLYRKGQDGAWKSTGPWVAQTDDFQDQQPPVRAGLADYVPGSNATAWGAQGGLRISVAGLGKILQMLMHQGEVKTGSGSHVKTLRLLSAAAVAAMQNAEWRYKAQPANGDTLDGEFYAWGLGMQIYTDKSLLSPSGKPIGDRLVPGGGITGFGHAGFAYGLQSLLFYDPVRRIGVVYAVSGSGVDPALHKGRYSSFYQWEERIIDAVYTHVLKGQRP